MADNFETKTVPDQKPEPAKDNRIFPAETIKTESGIRSFYRNNKWYVWASLAAVVIIGLLGYFAFRKQAPEPNKEANVNLSIDLEPTISANGDFLFRVKVENKDPSKLVAMNLDIIYPEGASYVSSVPPAKNSEGSRFEIPDLVSGQNAVVSIKAHMEGSINDTKEFGARLRYRYNNFNSDFEKKTSAETKLSASDILLEIEGPIQATPSQELTYEIKYANNSDRDLTNVRIQMDYPSGFTFVRSSPATDLSKNIWNLAKLAKGDSGAIKVIGNFGGSAGGESKTMAAELLVLDTGGSFAAQARTQFITQISGLPLVVTQTLLQNSTGEVSPGDHLNYKVHYQNNGQTPAQGVNIVVTLDSKVLDLTTIDAGDGQVSGNSITWNAASERALETVNPSSGGDLDFRVDVKNPAVKDTSKNLTIKSSIKIKSDEQEQYLPGNTIETKVSTVASLVGTVAYVSGNLPPKVGKDTVYRITFSLRNSTNDLASLQVAAFIPLDPSSFDPSSVTAQESSKVSFDRSTGKLVWNIGTLPAHTGDFSAPRVLQFNVKLRPTSVQSGSPVTLLRNIVATGKDSFTAQSYKLTQKDLTTRDVPDSDYSNNGIVVK